MKFYKNQTESINEKKPTLLLKRHYFPTSRLLLTPLMLFSRFAMLDIVFKFMAEMLGKAAHGEYGGIGQGADGAAGHIVADRIEQVQIFGAAFAFGNAVHHAV